MSLFGVQKTFLEFGEICPFADDSTIAAARKRLYCKNALKRNAVRIIPRGGYRLVDRQSFKTIQWITLMEKKDNASIMSAARGREIRLPMECFVDGYCEDPETDVKIVY